MSQGKPGDSSARRSGALLVRSEKGLSTQVRQAQEMKQKKRRCWARWQVSDEGRCARRRTDERLVK